MTVTLMQAVDHARNAIDLAKLTQSQSVTIPLTSLRRIASELAELRAWRRSSAASIETACADIAALVEALGDLYAQPMDPGVRETASALIRRLTVS